MRPPRSSMRYLAIAVVAVAVVGTSGCRWFKKDNALYAQSPETRPLEVPPDLDRPRTDGAMALPEAPTSVTRSGTAAVPADSNVSFSATGARDAVFAQVGEALAATDGVTVNSRSQVLGTYDVSYAGSQFLVRIASQQGGAVVSAVDPRGVAATGDAPTRLIASLQASLAQ
ncbi:hypothetical protein [Luteimonas terrae]|uniref:Lipoprotein n=1 Tax=Luteimonas terrae TaxID=1530191 RepID=A0ABU1XYG8_9GAMM|nr:hypothetical protein [Luteimonas terrae]MDR7193827.1 putative lipoprotein [Luteimonas terrae]